MNAPQESASGQLADWATGLNSQDIPGEIRARAQTCLLDTIGVAIAGASGGAARVARERSASKAERKDGLPRSARANCSQRKRPRSSTARPPMRSISTTTVTQDSCTGLRSWLRLRWPSARKRMPQGPARSQRSSQALNANMPSAPPQKMCSTIVDGGLPACLGRSAQASLRPACWV